ncbi:C6 zinc finger domain-containing protein [Colletotrichum plurivorum]|uniref:C6 zinc finger domain-containing protein n=1 Tax=Colletotrichum plurivorum TaxID=2175906 RepID=A0A8H6N6F9_9PEZI|nr:C6 zinc finger domain-containing protein [Colletotrichum plurivorum]
MSDEASSDAPFVPKRTHKKSRLGCANCKLRKVKCDEGRPSCRACRMRRTKCEYGPVAPRRSPPMSSASSTASSAQSECEVVVAAKPAITVQPLFGLPSADALDMKLLWFYTSSTYRSLSYYDDKQLSMNDTLQTIVVQHAFESPFLMDSLLELASLHMRTLGQAAPDPTRAQMYQARSLEGFRRAIQDPRPGAYGALLANSIMRPILATQVFRDAAASSSKELHILDWMLLWRGVQSIIQLTSVSAVGKNGMTAVFTRPPAPVEASATAAIPKDLLVMVSFMDRDDPDLAEMPTYQEALRELGSLFESLARGMDSVMVLRIITWGVGLVEIARLVNLAQAGRQRALIILAHYACFLKLVRDIWWLADVGEQSIESICHALGPEWNRFMGIPLAAQSAQSTAELTNVLLGDGVGRL